MSSFDAYIKTLIDRIEATIELRNKTIENIKEMNRDLLRLDSAVDALQGALRDAVDEAKQSNEPAAPLIDDAQFQFDVENFTRPTTGIRRKQQAEYLIECIKDGVSFDKACADLHIGISTGYKLTHEFRHKNGFFRRLPKG